MTEFHTPAPEEATVTLPVSQVAGWLERLDELETQEAARAAGAAAVAPELLREDGTPTAEFAKATLSGAVNAYTGILFTAFNRHQQDSPLARKIIKPSPEPPQYINTDRWMQHIGRHGIKTSWQEDIVNGVSNFETTHLHRLGDFDDLVGFSVNKVTRGQNDTLSFTLSDGTIKRITHTQNTPRKFRGTERSLIFELDLEPELLIRIPVELIDRVAILPLRFSKENGKFQGDYLNSRTFEGVQTLLARALKLMPDDYRPAPLA